MPSIVPTARSPFSFFSDVVIRTKSSPFLAKTVATPPVALVKRSTMSKSRLSGALPCSSAGVAVPLMSTLRAGSSTSFSGNMSANSWLNGTAASRSSRLTRSMVLTICPARSAISFAPLASSARVVSVVASSVRPANAARVSTNSSAESLTLIGRFLTLEMEMFTLLLLHRGLGGAARWLRSVDGLVHEGHVGAGHQALDVDQDQHPLVDGAEAGDVLGVERGRELRRRLDLLAGQSVSTSDTLSTTTPTTRLPMLRMMTTVNWS